MFSLVRRENGGLRPRSYERWVGPFGLFDTLARWEQTQPSQVFSPTLDANETKYAFVVSLDLPVIEEDDLEVSLEGGALTISGEREHEKVADEETYYACERSHGSFSRSFVLPKTADAENVTAELKNGVLTVSVGKRPEAQPKQITVKAS